MEASTSIRRIRNTDAASGNTEIHFLASSIYRQGDWKHLHSWVSVLTVRIFQFAFVIFSGCIIL